MTGTTGEKSPAARRKLTRIVFDLIVLSLLAVPGRASGQAVHLPPVLGSSLPDTASLLLISNSEATNEAHILSKPGVRLRIENGVLYILSDERTETVELGDRTVSEFMDAFRQQYPGVRVWSQYPTVKVRQLKTDTTLVLGDVEVVVQPRERGAEISAAAGVGFTLSETQGGESAALLRSAGVELDLVGSKPIGLWTVRSRVGFRTAEPISTDAEPVDEDGTDMPSAAPAADIGSLVRTAQALAVGVQLDYQIGSQIGLDSREFRVAVGGEASRIWAAPAEFIFPVLMIDGVETTIENLFDAEEIAAARRILDQVIPLGTVVAGPRIAFGSSGDPRFYLLADFGMRQYHQRQFGIRFRVTPPTQTEPGQRTAVGLLARASTPWEAMGRLGLGMRVSSAVIFRVDYVDAWSGRPNVQPLLRIMLTTPDLRFAN